MSVTVSFLELAIQSVDYKLRFLILTDLAPSINSLFFRVVMTAGALRSASLYIPTTVRVVNNVVSGFCHCVLPPVSLRAAGGAAIRVPVNRFCLRDGVDLIRVITDIGLASDSKSFRVLLGVHLVVQAGVMSLIIVDIIMLIHFCSFLLDEASI